MKKSPPWKPIAFGALILLALGAMLGVQPSGSHPAEAEGSGGIMTEAEFQRAVMHHWFPPDVKEPPSADIEALLPLKPGQLLDEGWQVRGINSRNRSIQVELLKGHALFVAQIEPLSEAKRAPVQTERYALFITQKRPSEQAFSGLDLERPLKSLAEIIQPREREVQTPKSLL